ncbi:hypothetical protein Tco_1318176 [Tanacetum coccineum]
MKNIVLTSNTPYPSRKIRRICARTSQETTKKTSIRRIQKTSIHHIHDLRSVETEFPAIFYNDALTSEVALLCEPTVSPLNDNQIDFRISFDESDDEDYTVIYDKNSFSYKIISVNDLKTDSVNDNYKVNMPSFPSSEPMVSYFDDFDFKDFEKEFPAISYNDALTSKLHFSEPTISEKARMLELKQRNMKNTILTSNMPIHQGRYNVSVPALHKKPRRRLLYAVSRRLLYTVSKI